MTLLLTLLVLAVVVAVAAVAMGRITGGLDASVSSLPARPLPDATQLRPADVERVRFSPALRGYRMEEVDDALDRLVVELARRDEVIAGLRYRLGEPGPQDLDDEQTPADLAHPADRDDLVDQDEPDDRDYRDEPDDRDDRDEPDDRDAAPSFPGSRSQEA